MPVIRYRGVAIECEEGAVSERNRRERLRLSVPPHDPEDDLRLACQTEVYDDITVKKGDGFWGQRI